MQLQHHSSHLFSKVQSVWECKSWGVGEVKKTVRMRSHGSTLTHPHYLFRVNSVALDGVHQGFTGFCVTRNPTDQLRGT